MTHHRPVRFPPQTVMIRREAKTIRGFPTRNLISWIKMKKLVKSDEISTNGRDWTPLFEHPQLLHMFAEPVAVSTEGEEKGINFSSLNAQLSDLAEILNDLR